MGRQLSGVNYKYGAPMGRPSHGPSQQDEQKFTLQRVPLDSGGYDRGGAYWGLGNPLYWACNEDGDIERFFRAPDRDAAKCEVRREFPDARFFR